MSTKLREILYLTPKICKYYHLPLHGASTAAIQMAAPGPEVVLFPGSWSYTQSARLFVRGISPLQSLCLHTGQHKQNEHTQIYMPQERFEPTISVLGRRETVYASDSMCTVIWYIDYICDSIMRVGKVELIANDCWYSYLATIQFYATLP
jgi:hypothetical protein